MAMTMGLLRRVRKRLRKFADRGQVRKAVKARIDQFIGEKKPKPSKTKRSKPKKSKRKK